MRAGPSAATRCLTQSNLMCEEIMRALMNNKVWSTLSLAVMLTTASCSLDDPSDDSPVGVDTS